LFTVGNLLRVVDSRDPQGALRSDVPPHRRHSDIAADQVRALFISLVDEISRNDDQSETAGCSRSRLTNSAVKARVIYDDTESGHRDVSDWTHPSVTSFDYDSSELQHTVTASIRRFGGYRFYRL